MKSIKEKSNKAMKKGKQKFERCCYNCKYRFNGCKEVFKVLVCDKFKFSSVCKSI